MTENEKKHRILEIVVTTPNKTNFDTDEMVTLFGSSTTVSELNVLCRELIADKDLLDFTHKDNSSRGAVGVAGNNRTTDAYNTNKYLKKSLVETPPTFNITGTNIHIGQNNGNYTQSSLTDVRSIEKPKNNIASFISKFWWAVIIPILVGIVLVSIEYNWFQ